MHRPARYQYLLMTGELTAHLNRVDQEAKGRVESLMKQMREKQGGDGTTESAGSDEMGLFDE